MRIYYTMLKLSRFIHIMLRKKILNSCQRGNILEFLAAVWSYRALPKNSISIIYLGKKLPGTVRNLQVNEQSKFKSGVCRFEEWENEWLFSGQKKVVVITKWSQLWSSCMATFLGNNVHLFSQKSKTPVVTTAEVSSDESTKADSPEQPQAVTMATQPKASLSTVHVQQSFHSTRTSIPVLTHSVSEVKLMSF